MNRRGVTLVELLIALAIVALVTATSGRALVTSLSYGDRMRLGREDQSKRQSFEDGIRSLLSATYVDPDATNGNTYFIGGKSSGTPTQLGQTSGQGGNGSNSGTLTDGGTAPDSMIFTITGARLSGAVLDSTNDFETNNQKFGPVGGVSEIALSLTANNDPGGHQGLFIRRQTPADGDHTQGGFQSVLSPDVSQITFEYFDGTNWDPQWDTTTQGSRRLPSLIRVTYRFTQDNRDHIFMVRIPASDATATNPVAVNG